MCFFILSLKIQNVTQSIDNRLISSIFPPFILGKLELLDYLSGFITKSRKKNIEEVLSFRTRYLSVVLEDIYQPHNASAVIRTCDCFGIQDVHIIENENEYTLNPKVVMGASKWVDMHKYSGEKNNSASVLKQLKEKGYKIAATSPHAEQFTPSNIPLDNKLALVFGTEMHGISEEVKQEADYFVKIPMFGFTESFNISVSASLCLSRLVERLHLSDCEWKLSKQESLSLKLDWVTKSLKNGDLLKEDFLRKRKDASNNLDD